MADAAGVALAQLHHFGSKQQLILDMLLESENVGHVAATEMYGQDRPLWQRYEQACDFLEDDLQSGYVRLLQEMIAAGWSDAIIGTHVREFLQGWLALLVEITRQAETTLGALGRSHPRSCTALVGQAFLGGEALLLLGFDRRQWPAAAARRFALVIRRIELARARRRRRRQRGIHAVP